MTARESRLIVVVDDDADDRTLIRRSLLGQAARSYTVLEAETGEEGLELLRNTDADCVILDFFLPDIDGERFIEGLKEQARGGVMLPIAVLTTEESDEVAVRALRTGAQDYLVKDGLTPTALVRAIENSIEKFRIQRDLVESRLAVELRNHKLEVLRDRLQLKIHELAQATQAKDQFMAVMSHEMRTPLNAIIGYADLLDLELEGEMSENQRQYINRIQVGGRHLLDLINDVLDLARADANRLEVDLQSVDVGAVIEEVGALLQSQAQVKGIALTVECGATSPRVSADLHRLRQVVTNIVGNAIKFTDEGYVRVTCEDRGDDEVVLNIEDSGIGIDPELLPLIFSDFYQVRGGLSREKGGSGLGLAISRKLATLMGAELEAESTVGVGSVFRIVLRRAKVDQDPVEVEEPLPARDEVPRPQAERPDRVTVVAFGEDEDTLVGLEKQVSSRVRLLWTTDPAMVPRMVAEENATLVVLDIASADGAAWRVAHALQEQTELTSTAIVLLPSIPAAATVDSAEGIDLGWLSLVPKPFTADQLTRAVSTAAVGHDGDRDVLGQYDVLVVDDDPDSRRVAAKFLSEANVRVREAADGESALIEMRRVTPDVVVLDLMMPILDGFGVLATMRSDPILSSVPVVVLTAKTLTEGERRFLARSAVEVLQKGAHRLADVAALVLRAAGQTQRAETTRTG